MALKAVWCVQHRDGWCAVQKGVVKHGRAPVDTTVDAPTRCGYHVIMPWGFERRLPDCPECLVALQGSSCAPAPK